nr:glycosyltransferase family 1 protein [Paenibacillus castaneae]
MNRGGAETLIMNLYRHIDRSKVQFDFLTCKSGVFDDEILELGGKIHRIPYLSEVGHNGYIQAMNQFFQEHASYKIVHSHMDKMSGFVLRAARLASIPFRIAHSHNTQSEGGFAAKLYKWYAGTNIARSATHYMACTNVAARWLFAGKAKAALILQNGIECDSFSYSAETRLEVRTELGIDDSTLVVGHVGRFAYQKNHTFLIDIFKELQKECLDSVLLLAGDGPLRLQIEQKVQALQLTNKVKFLGVRSDVERLVQSFDVVVFPSHHEGLGITLIEAQASGLPCLVSNHVTDEVDMGIGLIQFLSIKNTADYVKQITVLDKYQSRIIPSDALAEKGYDIKQTAHLIADYYLSHCEVTHETVDRVYTHI